MLQRAIYVSDAVGTAGQSILSIAQIVGVSDINNRRDHITGVLMQYRGQFLQLIEGARVDVERLLKRLAADGRHENMRILIDKPIDRRCFGTQPMATVDVGAEIAALIGDRGLETLAGDQLLQLYHRAAEQLDMAA
ncbi:hypothetical protein BH10PSE2_BH10PSE2_22800 [soil metagenome]